MAMDDLDRIFRRLVQQLRARYPQYLSRPFEAEEVYQVIVPYRHYRQELGIDTNQDYEVAVMRLLSGERSYFVVDREMRESLSRELESANPDTSLFRVYATHRVSVSPEAVQQMEQSGIGRGDDARLASVPVADNRRPRPSRPAGGEDGMDAPAAAGRSRTVSFGANGPSPNAGTGTSGSNPRFEGMPLPPSAERGMNARGRVTEAIPPAPPRGLSTERLAASPAPSAPPPAARVTGLTGHGGRIPGGGMGTPPSFADVDGGDGSARTAGSIPSRRESTDSSASAVAGNARGSTTHSPDAPMVTPRRSIAAEAIGGHCRYCTGNLPEGRQITFCPHCGQDLTVQQCPACSTELELGWKFCTTCGRSVGQS